MTNDERDAWRLETTSNAYKPLPPGDASPYDVRGPRDGRPVYEGVIHVGFGGGPVPYRIVSATDDVMEARECHALAVSTCRIACLTADVVRGKLSSNALKRAVTAPCIKRIETLAYLVDSRMRRDIELRARMRYLPVVPHDVSGMLVSETRLETAVKLSVGGTVFWASIALKRIGCRWMFVVIDMG